ncbi:hypothetical protein [Solilutibacter tolerans]|uniref:Uncharacterized protein n=1 Tax=Solilutibacter tolerans TaxID=1604334 RepID=A0A1N6N3G3_9GAMM|nr:hypothetical protein [Lysobacter tolerans]SIP86630.1 hypothetical protein SAMN05421546_0061 [Lysobacter tolerans]
MHDNLANPDHTDSLPGAQALAELFCEGVAQPHEFDWVKHAIGRLEAQTSELLVEGLDAPTNPELSPDLKGMLTGAPIAAALISWVRTSPRAALATRALVAVVNHAIAHPGLYYQGDATRQQQRYEAGLGLRRLIALKGELSKTLGARETDLMVALTTAAATLTHQPGIAATTPSYVQRLVDWLTKASAEFPLPAPTPLLDRTPALVPGPSCVIDESVDRARDAGMPQELVVRVDADGEPEEVLTTMAHTVPGIHRVLGRGPRLALNHLQIRAARTAATVGRVGRIEAITDGTISALGHALHQADVPASVRAVVVALLYAGVPAGQLMRWRIVDSYEHLAPDEIGMLCRPLALCVPTAAANGLPMPSPEHADACRPSVPHVLLMLPPELPFAQDVTRWVGERGIEQAFATRTHVLAARDWLITHAAATGSPVTLRRLPQVFREAVAATNVGTAEAALLTGHGTRGTGAASHYYSARQVEVGRWHLGALRWIAVRLGMPGPLSQPITPVEGFVGSKRHPTDAAVAAYMAALRAVPTSGRAGRPTIAVRAAHHARLQAIVFEIALWCSGARPFLHALDGLLHAGDVLAIDDKARPGGAGRSAARMVPVCSTLSSALAVWRGHRARLKNVLHWAEEPPLWFSITGEGQWRAATWSELRAPLPLSALPKNASRQWFRSALSARAVAGPVLDGWMGHAQLGSEPGAPQLGIAPAQVDPIALAALEAMTQALGLPQLRRSA